MTTGERERWRAGEKKRKEEEKVCITEIKYDTFISIVSFV